MGLFSKLTGMVINNTNPTAINNIDAGTLQAILIFYFVFIGIFVIAGYIYVALAYLSLAKKTRTEPRWLVWIPIGNCYLMAKMARMHWWPILLLSPVLLLLPFYFISKILFIIWIFVVIFCSLGLSVFFYIWNWKIFERVGKPGWWVLLSLIPYAGGILFMVFLGIAAWSDKKYN